jgi:hypothetical protein
MSDEAKNVNQNASEDSVSRERAAAAGRLMLMRRDFTLPAPPGGVSLNAARPGEEVRLLSRGFFTSDDGPILYTCLDALFDAVIGFARVARPEDIQTAFVSIAKGKTNPYAWITRRCQTTRIQDKRPALLIAVSEAVSLCASGGRPTWRPPGQEVRRSSPEVRGQAAKLRVRASGNGAQQAAFGAGRRRGARRPLDASLAAAGIQHDDVARSGEATGLELAS